MQIRPATVYAIIDRSRSPQVEPIYGWLESLSATQMIGMSRSLESARRELCQLVPDMVLFHSNDPLVPSHENLVSLAAILPRSRIICLGNKFPVPTIAANRISYVAMPVLQQARDIIMFRDELVACITRVAGDIRRSYDKGEIVASKTPLAVSSGDSPVEAIIMASSTGGTDMLSVFLRPIIESGIMLPVLIVQHIPAKYSAMLANKLQHHLQRPCEEGQNGALVESGKIYLAPGDRHMRLVHSSYTPGKASIVIEDTPKVQHCRPSADVLFASAASVFGAGSLAVVLTGMGIDGCAGAKKIVEAGGNVLAQDQYSSTVWGMPEAVINAGLASYVDNPESLALHTITMVTGRGN